MPKAQTNRFARRCGLLRRRLKEARVDAYLTFDPFDVQYLSGFPSEGCFFLSGRSGDFIFAPPLLAEQVRSLTASQTGLETVSGRELLKLLAEILRKNSLKQVGFDSSKVTLSLFKQLQTFRHISWKPLDAFVLSQRMIKDDSEIEAIETACRATAACARRAFRELKAGVTEEAVAWRLEHLFHASGSPRNAFDLIVAFNEHASFPHHVVTRKRLARNSVVLMDVGCTSEGYRSDLTRTGFFGKITKRFSEIYRIVQRAQQEGIAAVRDGVPAGRVDLLCRETIAKAGYEGYFTHGTGHGVGLEIHEPPRLGIGVKTILKAGMVVTVEPGIYLPGEFGVRIEDTLLVTKNGCRILTR